MTTTITSPTATPRYTFKDGMLPILVSCRVRLNQEQRDTLKAAYYSKLNEVAPQQGARIGASQVSTHTATALPIQRQLGSIVISDLLGTRETIPLDTILQLQVAFGVSIITPDDIREACDSYIAYCFSKYQDTTQDNSYSATAS